MCHDELMNRRNQLLEQRDQDLARIPPRGELKVQEIWRREWWSHTEIKLSYEGDPGERIPAYLLLPRPLPESPVPGILAVHQCACECDLGKEQVVGKSVDRPDQAYGLELVRLGYVVLAPDSNKVGERYDPKLRQPWECGFPGKRPDGTWGQSICCTAVGGPSGPGWESRCKTVFDVMRGIDMLQHVEQVAPNRIGMIGHSQGAGIIQWAMPLEDRIKVAVISAGGVSHVNFFSVIAPRPLLDIVGTADLKEEMEKKRSVHAAAREIYRSLGAVEALQLFEFDGGHSFPTHVRQAAYDWFKRWL